MTVAIELCTECGGKWVKGGIERHATYCRKLKQENPKEHCGRLKPPLYLIPPVADIEESMVLKHGADKYGAWNWRQDGIVASTYISAIRRHLAAWMDGEDTDPESGLPHLAHARACLSIMLDAESLGNFEDDRPRQGYSPKLLKEYTQADGRDADTRDCGTDGIGAERVGRPVVSNWNSDLAD